MCEHRAVSRLAEKLRETGCEVDVFPGLGVGEPTPDGAPLNIFARRKGAGNGRRLLLGAHLDTVPPGDPGRWTYGPWSGEIVAGRIYARGAHDDRSGAALLWMVADLLERMESRLAGDVCFLVTTEEEFSGGGMRAYLRRPDRIHPDAYLMVDGNPRESCIVAHPAALTFKISVQGPFRTAQEPETVHAANAIELMSRLVLDLKGFETRIRAKHESLGTDRQWPRATVVVTDIGSQGWISNIPERCVASGFCNVFPPLSTDEYRSDFERFVRRRSQRHAWLRDRPPKITWGPLDTPSLTLLPGSPFLDALARAHLGAFGFPLNTRHIGGWGDPRLLGCPQTIFYGPGGGGNDHTYDEYYELDDLEPVLAALVRLTLEWCGATREAAAANSPDS